MRSWKAIPTLLLIGIAGVVAPAFAVVSGTAVGTVTWYEAEGYVAPDKNAACALAPSLEIVRDVERLRARLKSSHLSATQEQEIRARLSRDFSECLNFSTNQPATAEIREEQIDPNHFHRDVKVTITEGPLAGKSGWTLDSVMNIPSGQRRLTGVASPVRVSTPHPCRPQARAPDFTAIVAGMGESGVLWMPDYPLKVHNVPLFPTIQAYLAWEHLTDTRGALNTATQVKSGTCVVVLRQIQEAPDAAFLQIRVSSGPHAGTVGFVPTGWVFEGR